MVHSRTPMGLPMKGHNTAEGIISFLCTSVYAPLGLYIRSSLYRSGSMQDRASGLPRENETSTTFDE